MINKAITKFLGFSLHFRLSVVKPFSNHLVAHLGTFAVRGQEAVVLTFGMIGLAFFGLCVVASMSSSAREPSI